MVVVDPISNDFLFFREGDACWSILQILDLVLDGLFALVVHRVRLSCTNYVGPVRVVL